MNAYYENTGYRAGIIGTRAREERQIGDGLIALICAIVAAVTCPVAIKLEKATVAIGLVFAFFGVVGGIDSGAISMGFGALLCLGAMLVEFLVFKSMMKKAENK